MGEQGISQLVETDWLAAHLQDPDLRVFDCTVYLRPDPPRIYRVESGRPDYDAGHIPNSDFIDLHADLSNPDSTLNFTMPDADFFTAAMSSKGVGIGARVVLYSRENIQWSTRVWWMLRAMGFANAAVLNGGFDKWQSEGRPVTTAPTRYPPARFTARPRARLFCTKDEVLGALGDAGACIVNALRPELHDGSSPVNYGRPGHIPGSVNVPGIHLIDPDTKTYRPTAELERLFDDAGARDRDRIVVYCGGGIAATNDAFVLTLLGHGNVSVYDASMSEWAKDPALPMETG